MDRPPIVGRTHPLILKDGELFFLCDEQGRVQPDPLLGLGLFYRDCRFLCRYELRLADEEPAMLMCSATEGFLARFELTNPPFPAGRPIAAHSLSITRQLTLDAERSLLHDHLAIRNCTLAPIDLPLLLRLGAGFEDIFALRGTKPKKRGEIERPDRDGLWLSLRYRGADRLMRRLAITATPAPEARDEGGQIELCFLLRLAPQQVGEISLFLHVAETAEPEVPLPPMPHPRDTAPREADIARRWLQGFSRVESDDPRLDRAIGRSLANIRLLTIEREEGSFIAAGVPWFAALFGRDSLIPALQCLAYRPELAAHTLRVLARHQGRRYAKEQKEEPGKILHELRVGEMARLAEVPEHPSYASVDSTLLFLITLARHAQWTGSLALFDELRGAVEGALAWMRGDGDANRDGYVDYDNGTEGQPSNQGWKDSADAIVYPDGRLVRGRISLVEVQAYAWAARRLIAGLYRRAGDGAAADRLEAEAEVLGRRFNRDFWMEQAGCYCLALDQEGRQVSVVTSNPGHALWTGIADPDKARATAARLMAPDMFSGWGIRTLSEREARFNPIGYHTGSIWPFDTGFCFAGLRRYGCDELAARVFTGLFDAARRFEDHRLPEFFCGLARRGEAGPAHCPRADPLQAWSSGALPFMLVAALGLEADGFARRLAIRRPLLPLAIDRLDLSGLRVGDATADLRFERRGGQVEVSLRRLKGALAIDISR